MTARTDPSWPSPMTCTPETPSIARSRSTISIVSRTPVSAASGPARPSSSTTGSGTTTPGRLSRLKRDELDELHDVEIEHGSAFRGGIPGEAEHVPSPERPRAEQVAGDPEPVPVSTRELQHRLQACARDERRAGLRRHVDGARRIVRDV